MCLKTPENLKLNSLYYNLYSSPDIIRQMKSRRMRWAGHVACMGEDREVYNVMVIKHEGESPLGRPRRRREYGNKMNLRVCRVDSSDSG
jgi:hypothetical protein